LSAWACSADQSAQKAESVTAETAGPETSSETAAADTSASVDKDSAEKSAADAGTAKEDVNADQDLVGSLGAEVVSEAIIRAVYSAESAYGIPSASDLK